RRLVGPRRCRARDVRGRVPSGRGSAHQLRRVERSARVNRAGAFDTTLRSLAIAVALVVQIVAIAVIGDVFHDVFASVPHDAVAAPATLTVARVAPAARGDRLMAINLALDLIPVDIAAVAAPASAPQSDVLTAPEPAPEAVAPLIAEPLPQPKPDPTAAPRPDPTAAPRPAPPAISTSPETREAEL